MRASSYARVRVRGCAGVRVCGCARAASTTLGYQGPVHPPLHGGSISSTTHACQITSSSHCGVWGWWSKRAGGRGQCRGTTTEHRSSPWAPHQPKLACNSGTRTFCSARKRCNSNGAISTFEIRVGELHATFLRNHNMRRHKGTTKCPKQKTTQAQKTPTTPTAATTATSTGGTAPVMWRCTRTEEVHCLRIGCSAPTYKNKRGTGTPNHSPPHPSMRSWALLVAGRARRPRHHLHPGPLRHLPHPYMRRAR